MLLLSVFSWLLRDRDAQTRHLDHYGSMVANQLTRLSKDAMVREDVIALNVLAEQVASDPAISSVTVYSLDGRTLASYGAVAGDGGDNEKSQSASNDHEFNRPIQMADATAGFVRVTVDPAALEPDQDNPLPPALLRTVASWLLSALALWGFAGWLTRPSAQQPDAQQKHSADGLPQVRNAILLVARLFNSAEMSTARRDALLDATEARIAQVSTLYNAEFARVEAGAVGVIFESPDSEDRAFQAACAALVIGRLCNQPGGGRYRYSLQQVSLPQISLNDVFRGDTDAERQNTLHDALLHAALADDNTIALSGDYARGLPRPERLELTREHNPILAELQTSQANDYYLLSGANAATEAMLKKQLAALQH